MGRPVLLLPLGLVVALVALVYGLGTVASHRWGDVVANDRACGSEAAGTDLCAERIGVRVEGPLPNGRTPGNTWRLFAAKGMFDDDVSVDVVDDVPLQVRRGPVFALVKQGTRDVVGLEVDDTVLPVGDVGTRGVLHRIGIGLMGVTLGVGLVLVALRMRRDSGWTGRGRAVRTYGSAWLAFPVLAGFALYMSARFV